MVVQELDCTIDSPEPSQSLNARGLADLPNEILLAILYCFPTPVLLPLFPLNHRFAHLILKVFHDRLLSASQLSGSRSLQLECYHPSLRLTAEALLCCPLGIDKLAPPDPERSPVAQLQNYNNAFTRFRPYRKGTTRVRPRRHPAGDVPGSRTFEASHDTSTTQQVAGTASQQDTQQPESSISASSQNRDHPSESDIEEEIVLPAKQNVNLDAHEMFTQLQTTTSLVTAGPKSGFVYSAVTASEGVVRVFRNWLQEQDYKRAQLERHERLGQGTDRVIRREDGGLRYANPPVSPFTDDERHDLTDSAFLWVNDNTVPNVGVRFTVAERRWRRDAPILMRADEEVAVSYEAQIEEVVVRSRHLLTVTEQGLRERDQAMGGKAIIIGTW